MCVQQDSIEFYVGTGNFDFWNLLIKATDLQADVYKNESLLHLDFIGAFQPYVCLSASIETDYYIHFILEKNVQLIALVLTESMQTF